MNRMLLRQVKTLVAKQFDVEIEAVTAEANFRETLAADSLDLIQLAMAVVPYLEPEEVIDEEMRRIETVGELVSYLETQRS